jgi:hypothetical protein
LNRNPVTIDDHGGNPIGGGRHDQHADALVLDSDFGVCRGRRQPGDGAGLHPPGRRRDLRRRSARDFCRRIDHWADGTRSNLASPHPSVIIGNKSSVVIGPGVFVGKGNGMVPMENPSAPNKARCPVLDGVSYCN